MKTTNKMTVILLMLNHFNLFSKPYIKKRVSEIEKGDASLVLIKVKIK